MSEEKVVIEEPKEVVEEEIVFDTEGLSQQEIEAGKKTGVIKEPEPKKEPEKSKENVEEKGEDKPADPADFQEMDEAYNSNQDKFHKNFSSNAKALYFRYKKDKRLRQETQEKLDELSKERDFLTTKEKSYIKQLTDIEAILERIDKGDETVTTADIRKVIAFKKEEAKEAEKAEKKEDKPSDKHIAYLAEKSKNTELLGKSKFDNFEDILTLANEVVAKDKDLAVLITNAYHNPEVDEEELLNKIVKIARTHEDFGKDKLPQGKVEKKDKKEIDRMVENAKKKKSSASLSSGSGKREISYDDLTVEDIPKLTQKQWNQLPEGTRKRLLQEAN